MHWYGIIIVFVVLIVGLLGLRVVMWVGEDFEDGWSMFFLVMIFVIVGVWFYYVVY